MKKAGLVLPVFILINVFAFSQNEKLYNVDKKGFVAEGYDVVSYFNGNAEEGSNEYVLLFKGVKYKFSSEKNKATFKASPSKYVPQYGGWCAYAMGNDGSKVEIDPKTFEIRDGKLYLFYNKFFTNTLDKWKEEGPEKLKKQADENWGKLKGK